MKQGFLMMPGVIYRCCECGIGMRTTYIRYIEVCERCGQAFLGSRGSTDSVGGEAFSSSPLYNKNVRGGPSISGFGG